MAFKKRRYWDSQPQEVVGVASAFADGLALLFTGPNFEEFGGDGVTVNVDAGRVATPNGLGAGTGTVRKYAKEGLSPAKAVSVLAALWLETSSGANERIFQHQNAGSPYQGYALIRNAAGKIVFGAGNSGGIITEVTEPVAVLGFHAYMGTFDGANVRLYRDGVLIATAVRASGISYSGTYYPLLGGYGNVTTTQYLRGKHLLLGVWSERAFSGLESQYLTEDYLRVRESQTILVPVSAGGAPTLTVPDSAHAHTLDSVVLTSSTTLAVQDMAHGHALDAPTLSTGTALAVADSLHAHSLDNVTVSTTGSVSLTVADSLHAHALDNVGLTSQTDLVAADLTHGHALDGVTLTLGGVNLVIADIMHAHALDNVALTLDTYLAVADLLHAHTLDNVLVSIPGGTLDLILKILVNRQELNPATGTFTLYDNDGTTVLYTTNAWADAAGTVPYSGGALRRIDALI